MTIKPVKDDADHKAALARIEALIDQNPQPDSPEADELNALAALVQDYESTNFPIEPPDPVDAILFRMEQQNLNQRDLVPYIGTRSRVSEVLARKRPLTLPMIRALHFGLGIPAPALLREPVVSEPSGAALDWKRFPIRAMIRRGWIQTTDLAARIDPEPLIRKFISQLGPLSGLLTAYRRSEHVRSARSMDEYALLAWTVQIASKALSLSDVSEYQPGTVTIDFMRSVARLSVLENGPVLAQEFLRKHGIALWIEPHLERTYLDGAAVLLRLDRPIIGLTIRYDRIDNFWFTLMHELAHVGCHFDAGVTVFYDDLDVNAQQDSREAEADQVAGEALIPSEAWIKSPASKLPTPEAVSHLARQLSIHPAIVAGRIRHEKKRYRLLPTLVGSGQVRRCFPQVNWAV